MYFFFLKKVITVFNASKLRSQIEIVTLVLLELEDFGLDLGDQEVLLVGFDLGRGEVLTGLEGEKWSRVLYCRKTCHSWLS